MRFPYRIADARYDAAGAREMSVFMRTIRAESPFKLVKPVPIAFGKWKRMGILYLNILFHRVASGATNKIIVIDPANEELIRQLKIWERKDAESEDAVKEDDHGPDALVAGVVPIAERHSDMVTELREAAKKTYRQEAKAAVRAQLTLIEAQWNVVDAPVGDGSKILVFGDDEKGIDILIPVGHEVAKKIAAKLLTQPASGLAAVGIPDISDLRRGGDRNGS